MTPDYTALCERLRAYQWGQLDRPHEEAASAIEALQAERDALKIQASVAVREKNAACAERDRARGLLRAVLEANGAALHLCGRISAELGKE